MTNQIPDDVAFLARFPVAAGPGPHPDSKAVRVMTGTCAILVTSMPGLTFVEPLQVAPADAGSTVREVREVLRGHDRTRAAWCLDSVVQAGLASELRRLGLTDYEDPPMEPTFAAMALTEPPADMAGTGIEVRRCVELDDYLAAAVLSADVTGMAGEDRVAFLEAMARRHLMEHDGRSHMRQYLALLDGEVAGEAQASLCDAGSNLSGSAVLPEARGRGVYRALVRARWDDAVASGRGALTVQAGAMSRPILARLGFQTVAEMEVLRDSFE